MEENIMVGDVVQLKAGNSPDMTVDKIFIPAFSGNDKKWALCSWFVDDEPRSKEFPLSSLKKV